MGEQAAGAALGIADVALGREYTGHPVAAAMPRPTASIERRATAQTPQPPRPQPPRPRHLVSVLDHLLLCCLGMQAVAELASLDSELGGWLACSAMSAMAVIAVTALPDLAAVAKPKPCADVLQSHGNTTSKRLLDIVRDTWCAPARPAPTLLSELTQVCKGCTSKN